MPRGFPHTAPWHASLLPATLRLVGGLVVVVILGFVLLPVFVVTVAAFNERAILSFPPAGWSWRS